MWLFILLYKRFFDHPCQCSIFQKNINKYSYQYQVEILFMRQESHQPKFRNGHPLQKKKDGSIGPCVPNTSHSFLGLTELLLPNDRKPDTYFNWAAKTRPDHMCDADFSPLFNCGDNYCFVWLSYRRALTFPAPPDGDCLDRPAIRRNNSGRTGFRPLADPCIAWSAHKYQASARVGRAQRSEESIEGWFGRSWRTAAMAAAAGGGGRGGKGGGRKGDGSLASKAWRQYLLQLQQHPLRTKVPTPASWFVFPFSFFHVSLSGADDHGGVPRRRQRLCGAEALRLPEDWQAPPPAQDGKDAALRLFFVQSSVGLVLLKLKVDFFSSCPLVGVTKHSLNCNDASVVCFCLMFFFVWFSDCHASK
jgi:hypothetical protein